MADDVLTRLKDMHKLVSDTAHKLYEFSDTKNEPALDAQDVCASAFDLAHRVNAFADLLANCRNTMSTAERPTLVSARHKLEKYYAAMDARDKAEKVMQDHARQAQKLANELVACTCTDPAVIEVVDKLEEGKWPRRPKSKP